MFCDLVNFQANLIRPNAFNRNLLSLHFPPSDDIAAWSITLCSSNFVFGKSQFAKSQEVSNVRALQIFECKVLLSI